GKLNVLCSAFSDRAKGGSGDVEPVAHWRNFGKGRCFHLILGHDAAAMRNPGFQALLLRGTEWAATGRVTIAAATVADPFKDLPAYRAGGSRLALTAIAEIVAKSSSDTEKRDIAAGKLVAVLKSREATNDAKAFALEQLGLIGQRSAVPAMAPLLLDEDLTLFVRRALERIGGDASAAALRETLPEAKGQTLVGIINSLGAIGDAASPAALNNIAGTHSDPAAVLAAIEALGHIHSPDAFTVLTMLRPRKKSDAMAVAAIDHAMLAWAQAKRFPVAFSSIAELSPPPSRPVRIAALRGLLSAEPSKDLMLKTLADPDIQAAAAAADAIARIRDNQTAEYAKAIATVPVANRPLLINALGRRGDAAACPAVMAATSDADPATRAAAYEALPAVADATVVVTLMERYAKSEPDRPAIAGALQRLHAPASNAAILATLKLAPPATQAFLIPIVTARQIADAAPVLSDLAASPERDVRMAAITALKGLVTPSDLTALLATLAKLPDDEARSSLEPILGALVSSKPDPDLLLKSLDAAPQGAKATILRLLTRAPSPASLDAVRKALADATLKDAAVRSLSDWPDAAAESDLLGLATKTDNVTHNVLAIRGLVRLATNPSLHNKPAAIELLGKLAPLARRDEEKKLIADALGRCNSATNLARGAKASSPDGLQDDGDSSGEAAAIDGDYDTYWDKTDDQSLYRLVLTWPAAVPMHAIRITGYQHHNFAPKDFTILADDRPVQQIKGAVYDNNVLLIKFPRAIPAKSLELRITGYYGHSPAIRELEVFDDGPLPPPAMPKKK
ncbi:MAG: HEAT repeat domain-containing protein, partial [Tepidisphaeraceae bacterium]